jgi:hypothetical protein
MPPPILLPAKLTLLWPVLDAIRLFDAMVRELVGSAMEAENEMLWGIEDSDNGLVPVVNPSDIKNMLKVIRDAQAVAPDRHVSVGIGVFKSVCSPNANVKAVWYRAAMLGLCEKLAVLPSKKPDDEFEDALLEVAATFPMKALEPGITYKGLPFDAQEFVKQVERAKGASPAA